MKKHLKHLGSTIAIIFGVLLFLSTLSIPENININKMIMGFDIILGALAYRSAKKRRLGEVENTETRLYTEISLIALILASIVFRNRSMLKHFIATQPAEALYTLVIIPLWVIIAYTIIASKARKTYRSTVDSIDVKEQESVDKMKDQKLVGIPHFSLVPELLFGN